jgi:hypothetical protein
MVTLLLVVAMAAVAHKSTAAIVEIICRFIPGSAGGVLGFNLVII